MTANRTPPLTFNPKIEMTQRELLERLAAEQPQVWRKLARRILGEHPMIEDLIQECWQRLLKSRTSFSDYDQLRRYFCAVLINRALDYRKQLARQRSKLSSLDERFDLIDSGRYALAPQAGLEISAELQPLLREAMQLLARLPEPQRQAIVWLLLDEDPRPLEQVSREKGIAASTLRSRLKSGLEKLRKGLRAQGMLGYRAAR